MPFSKSSEIHSEEYWTSHFEKFLKPNIEAIGNITVYRSNPLRGDILKQIIYDLVTADCVIADITHLNANVFWELGVRQSFKHGTVTIMEQGTKLPFDIGGKGTLTYYRDNHILNESFKSALIMAVKDCIDNPNKPDSHVLEAISGRGTFYETITLEETKRKILALSAEMNSNETSFKSICECCKLPQGNYASTRLRYSCTELLISTRYLNIEENIYFNFQNYFDWLIAINEHASKIPSGQLNATNWMIAVEKNFLDISASRKQEIDIILNNLKTKI